MIIEIQKGSKNKYEIDKETGLIKLDPAMQDLEGCPVRLRIRSTEVFGLQLPTDIVF